MRRLGSAIDCRVWVGFFCLILREDGVDAVRPLLLDQTKSSRHRIARDLACGYEATDRAGEWRG